jgi:beta-phosphoglucomutase family hydrolase
MPPAKSTRAQPKLDAVSAHWRVALNRAQDALDAASLCNASLGFPPEELRDRRRGLAQERETTAQLIDAIAREERVHLVHPLSAPRASKRMLGLPTEVLACVFDLEGVLTGSASIHARAWAETFDPFLLRRAEHTGERFAPFKPFTPRDYDEHIHGKPRLDGVHAFLASRGIRLPHGRPEDAPGTETVYGLANAKAEALKRHLDREGVAAFEGSLRYLEAAHEAHLTCAVVSASAHSDVILESAGLTRLVDERIDADSIRAERLQSKPAPDTLLAACRQLGVRPEQAAAFETTLAGVEAAEAADFAVVVAVDRSGQDQVLRGGGADTVVTDLAALLDRNATGS